MYSKKNAIKNVNIEIGIPIFIQPSMEKDPSPFFSTIPAATIFAVEPISVAFPQ